MRTHTTFSIGDKVVYPMHGIGWVVNILTQTIAERPRRFYQIVLEARTCGDVLVPVDHARALGLRRPLQARHVRRVLQRLRQATPRPPQTGQNASHYLWCKARIRQHGVLGLAEVRRLLHDLEGRERLTDMRLRRLRTYVYTQLPTEIAHALHCSPTAAAHVVDVALTSQHAMPTLPSSVPEECDTTW